jgi:hypothetical protein
MIFHVNFSQALVPAVIFAIAISPMFEYWTLGGLDTPFQAFLLLLAPLTQVRFFLNRSMTNAVAFGSSLVLMSLVRTEGFIYLFASLAVPLAARERRGSFWLLTPVIAAGVVTLGLITVRFLFTGAMWPNPTYAKIGGLFSQFGSGLGYVAGYYIKGGLASQLQGVGTAYAAASLFYFGLIRKRQGVLTGLELTTVAFSSYVVLYETFVVFSGGDWMEYFRFLVPTIPLKILLLVNATTVALNRLALRGALPLRTETLQWVIVFFICAAAASQQTYAPIIAGDDLNCAAPLTDVNVSQLTPILIEEQLISHNCTQARDEVAILPFIREELPSYVRRVGQVRIASSQAGYVPYHIREYFSPQSVFFIDTLGLATRNIAQIDARKSVYGVHDGDEIDQILAGHAGKLSASVLRMKPNMVYLLGATPERRENFKKLGYTLVWDRPNAAVFFKEVGPDPMARF